MKFVSTNRGILEYELPVNEIGLDFCDRLKTASRGYASMDYEFHEFRRSSLVKLDFGGNVAGPSEWPVNRAGVAIHGSILAARPDINCVFHTHLPYTTAVSAPQCGLLPMSQAALRVQGRLLGATWGAALGGTLLVLLRAVLAGPGASRGIAGAAAVLGGDQAAGAELAGRGRLRSGR